MEGESMLPVTQTDDGTSEIGPRRIGRKGGLR